MMPPAISRIQETVAKVHRVSVTDIVGRRQDSALVRARHVAMYLSANLTAHSFPEIGRCFKRDHTSVMYAAKRVGRMIAADKTFAEHVDFCSRAIGDPALLRSLDAAGAAICDVVSSLRTELLAAVARDPEGLLRRLKEISQCP